MKKRRTFFEKRGRFFELSPTFFFVSWEKISCLMGEIFCSMRAKFLVDDNELLVKSNNIEEILGVFRGANCDFYALKWEGKWRRSGGEKITT